jgi:hypothetical protein
MQKFEDCSEIRDLCSFAVSGFTFEETLSIFQKRHTTGEIRLNELDVDRFTDDDLVLYHLIDFNPPQTG